MKKIYHFIDCYRIKKVRLRAEYYRLFFEIGTRCRFQKIFFNRPYNVSREKSSIRIGNNVTIFRNTELTAYYNNPIVIGNDTFINQGCLIRPNVTIGNNVAIGMCVNLISDSHNIGSPDFRAGELIYLPIKIGDGCWIGTNSTILGSVSIGNGTIIAAGALVNKDCESNCLYGGVPAKLIKKLPIS